MHGGMVESSNHLLISNGEMVGSSNREMVVESLNRLIVECMVIWLNRRIV